MFIVFSLMQKSMRSERIHFSHQHFLNHRRVEESENIFCYACENGLEDPSYGCDRCKIYFHKSCIDLPIEIHHPFHLHPLTLEKPHLGKYRYCTACHRHCGGFTYNCNKCKFYLDTACASLQPSIIYNGAHPHVLTLFLNLYFIPKCVACNSTSRGASILRCIECNFNIHLMCSPLPNTIKHEGHQHSELTLMDTFVVDDDERYCHVCKKKKDPGECMYYCATCPFMLDFNCLISEGLLSLEGEYEDVQFMTINRSTAVNKVLRKGLIIKDISDSTEHEKGEEIDDELTQTLFVAGDEGGGGREEEIQNYVLHEHPLTLYEKEGDENHNSDEGMFDDSQCPACEGICLPVGSFYICKLCWPKTPIFHQSCAELPLEFQTNFHPHGTLHLVQKYINNMSVKDKYRFCCDKCSFEIAYLPATVIIGYLKGQEYLLHPNHSTHPLTLMEVSNGKCEICYESIRGLSYGCLSCDFYIHNSFCDLPSQIRHPLHLPHDLVINYQLYYIFARCIVCGLSVGSGTIYECRNHDFGCAFHLHPKCASLDLTPNVQYTGHVHLLILIDFKVTFQMNKECNACGFDILGPPYLRCLECDINFHILCRVVSPPQTVKHEHHQHSLNFITLSADNEKVLVRNDSALFHCDICKKERNPKDSFYSCAECDCNAHVQCVVTKFGDCDRKKLKHCSHRHVLLLCDYEENDNKLCCACEIRIQGPTYTCDPCKFYLHEGCAERPSKIQHSFHDHVLTLPESYSPKHYECNACHKKGYGFTYSCKNENCNFHLDLDCALLQPSVEFKGHEEHMVTIFEKVYGKQRCISKCSFTSPSAYYLVCVRCNFYIHLSCTPLPEAITHESHHHSLILIDIFADDDYEEECCDICEDKRDREECVYYCADCNFVAEFTCMIPKVLFLQKGEHGDVQFRTTDRQKSNVVIRLQDIIDSLTEEENMKMDAIDEDVDEALANKWKGSSNTSIKSYIKLLVNSRYSDEALLKLMENLYHQYQIEKSSMGGICDSSDEIVNVGDYKITLKLAPVLKKLLHKYGDICGNCDASPAVMTIFLVCLCGVVQSMCDTDIKDIRDGSMFIWWYHLKFVQHGGLKIDFSINHLKRTAYARYGTVTEARTETDNALYKLHAEAAQLTRKIDEQKAALKQLKKEIQDEISTYATDNSRKEAKRLSEAMELIMKKAGDGLL